MSEEAGTRQRLLDAAIAIIETEGESGVRVDRVSEMAHITKPSLYHFFGDRSGLIVAAQAERYRRALFFGQDEFIRRLNGCRSQSDFAAVIRAVAASFATPEGARRRAVRFEVLGSAVSRPELRAQVEAATATVADELGEAYDFAKEQGWILSPFSGRSLAMWWLGLILSRHLLDNNTELAMQDEWRQITEFVIGHLTLHEH